ncbi:MAG: hypothetical protein M1445_12465 [Bacteroidetes bacterium]|nr:hypothetical protein [Bacteroidota bacterium]
MNDANDNPGVTPEGSQLDSPPQDTQGGVIPTGDTTGNQQDANGQPLTAEEAAALREENTRLKGTVSAINRKYMQALRQGVDQRTPGSQGEPGEGGDQFQVFSAAFDLAGARVREALERDIIPLYDGSDPSFEGQPALSPTDLARIRTNPLAFLSPRTFKALFKAQTEADVDRVIEVASREIEEHMAARIDSSQEPTPKAKGARGKQINPSPAPAVTPQGQPAGQDLWSMPLEELEKMVPEAQTNLRNQGFR